MGPWSCLLARFWRIERIEKVFGSLLRRNIGQSYSYRVGYNKLAMEVMLGTPRHVGRSPVRNAWGELVRVLTQCLSSAVSILATI